MMNELSPTIQFAGALFSETLRGGGKLMFCGNGGPDADSQHLAAELTVKNRRPLPAKA